MALVLIHETPQWKKLLSYVGPGFLVSVGYLDPGNLETDLQAGANHKYELLWIVLVGLTFALLIQSRSANLGVVTGKHLSEHCKTEYPNPVNYILWILAEVSVIAADIPQVIGTAFALNILFNIPIWCGVLLAGFNTLLILGLQRYGIRKLEVAIEILVLVVGGCFFSMMVHTRTSPEEILAGMFIPKLSGTRATRDAIALLGALIMPHNLFLHSALVISRKIHHSFEGIRSARKYFLLESSLALFIAFLINVAVVSVSGSVCWNRNLSLESKAHCENITLNSAAFLLKNSLGKWSSKVYAISLLASGQSSTVTGTYAGQYIMQLGAGFSGSENEAVVEKFSNKVILSFELPFALVPLLRFTSSEAKMGPHKSSLLVTFTSWLLGFCSIGINLYFLSATLMGRITNRGHSSKASSIVAGVFVFPIMILYVALLAYLILKKETPVTIGSPPGLGSNSVRSSESEFERRLDGIPKVHGMEGDDIVSAA